MKDKFQRILLVQEQLEKLEKEFYVIRERISTCNICHCKKDLRAGVCFECSDQVDGQNMGKGWHLLWDSKNKDNKWLYKELRS